MLRQRVLVASILLPLVLVAIVVGGYLYLGLIIVFFGFAAWEYAQLFRSAALRPAAPLIVAGASLLAATGWFPGLNPHGVLFAAGVVAPLAWHLVDFERGAATSGTDFCVTVAGIFYLGILGSAFGAVRQIPEGLWWMLAAVVAVALADTAAYFFGRALGKHRLAPRLSPNKTWEGFAGGVAASVVGVSVYALVLRGLGVTVAKTLTWPMGALLGLLVGLLAPVGDLGVSMLKRQVGLKDTGNLLPGHGGMFDRIDSWLVGVPLTYFFALLLQR